MKLFFLTGLCLATTISCGLSEITETTTEKTLPEIQNDSASADTGTFIGEPDGGTDSSAVDTGDDNNAIEIIDYTEFGPHYPYGIAVADRVAEVTNCSDMNYKVYTPYADNPPVIILGHGFARGPDPMSG